MSEPEWFWRSDVASDHSLAVLAEDAHPASRISREPPTIAALAEENAHLRSVLGHCPRCVAVLDMKGVLVGCNREFGRVFGGQPPMGKPLGDYVVAGDRPLLDDVIGAAGREVPASAIFGLSVGDSLRQLEFVAATLPSPDGTVFGVVVAADDRTAQLARDEDVDALRSALHDGDRQAAFKLAQASLCHDVANLLTVALFASEQLETARLASADLTPEALGSVLGQLASSLQLASEVIGRARKDTQEPLTGPAATAHLRRNVERVLLARRRNPRVRVDAQVPSDLCVRINDIELSQVLSNLVANATHAIEEGDGTGTIRIRGELTEEGAVRVVVQDDGPGIQPRDLQGAFEPHRTTRAHLGGTGLGLALVRSLVERAQGHVRAVSTPGEGTRFELTLLAG